MSSGAGTSSAQFDGGGWGLKKSASYYSYYPFIGDIYLDRQKIPVSYEGQKQWVPDATDHVGPFDFMYATGELNAAYSGVSFQYHHLGAFIRLTISSLPAGTYTKAAITFPEAVFVTEGYYDLLAETPAITPTATSKQLVIDLESFAVTASSSMRIYLVAVPAAISDTEFTVSLLNDKRTEYQCKKTSSTDLEAGHIKGFACNSFTEVPQSMGLIITDWGDGGSIGGDAE